VLPAELRQQDHLDVLRAMVTWAADETPPILVEGPGLVDVAYWQQQHSLAAHLVNYNNPMAMAGAFREAIPTGPYRVSLRVPEGNTPISVALLESGQPAQYGREGERLSGSCGRRECPDNRGGHT